MPCDRCPFYGHMSRCPSFPVDDDDDADDDDAADDGDLSVIDLLRPCPVTGARCMGTCHLRFPLMMMVMMMMIDDDAFEDDERETKHSRVRPWHRY